MLHRHELTCEAKTRLNFPGNAYVVPPTIVEQLSDEGIQMVPDHLRFFQHFATFEFESMFSKNNLPENTAKLEWENIHVPLSVSVCSNVPGFKDAKCFITNGNAHDFIKEYISYLVEISQENYRLLLGNFEDIFAEIDQKIEEHGVRVPTTGPSDEDLAEMLVELQEESEHGDDRGINVLESDDEDDEFIQPSLMTQWIVKKLTFTERWIEI